MHIIQQCPRVGRGETWYLSENPVQIHHNHPASLALARQTAANCKALCSNYCVTSISVLSNVMYFQLSSDVRDGLEDKMCNVCETGSNYSIFQAEGMKSTTAVLFAFLWVNTQVLTHRCL